MWVFDVLVICLGLEGMYTKHPIPQLSLNK